MRATIALSVLLTARLVATAAADPSLADASGQWFCQPDRQDQPQIQIDFLEGAYRRCDQHICSIYPLLPVEMVDGDIRISFGGVGTLDAPANGARYVETVTVGGTDVVNRGSCAFRSLDELYIERPEATAPERARL